MNDIEAIQIWPNGQLIRYSGYPFGHPLIHDDNDKVGTPATEEQRRAIQINVSALRYQQQEIYCCDSSLVDDAMSINDSQSDLAKEFSYDNVENLRPDPSDWDLAQCQEFLNDEGIDSDNLVNPEKMTRIELIDELGGEQELEELTDEELRTNLTDEINNETVDGLNDWRDAINDNYVGAEIYEWYRVSEWLGKELISVGVPVLNNNYGYWWGRTCTGQNNIMDGTLQKVAAKFVT